MRSNRRIFWVIAAMLASRGSQRTPVEARRDTTLPRRSPNMSAKTFQKPTDDQLRRQLTPLQYEVTQHEATEPPFRNGYWDNHAAGLYVDVVSGEPLFSSRDKFDSGT